MCKFCCAQIFEGLSRPTNAASTARRRAATSPPTAACFAIWEDTCYNFEAAQAPAARCPTLSSASHTFGWKYLHTLHNITKVIYSTYERYLQLSIVDSQLTASDRGVFDRTSRPLQAKVRGCWDFQRFRACTARRICPGADQHTQEVQEIESVNPPFCPLRWY
jgi:hypothetical protein